MTQPRSVAIIGGGAGIATTHLEAIAATPGLRLAALCDVSAAQAAPRAAAAGVPYYADHREMLAREAPEIAVICTPHPLHPPIAADCFAAGCHVLTEKPIAVEIAEADAMVAAAEAAGRLLAVSFQQRFRPEIAQARAMIAAGELGEILRVLVIEPWYRPAAYFRSAGWRGTWRGEGGGVMMNQASHTLDLMCYLAGRPARVWGVARTRAHAIETEDTAHAMLEFANGAPGYFYTSTVDVGPQSLEIIGDRAALRLSKGQLTVTRFSPAQSELRRDSQEMYSAPAAAVEQLTPAAGGPVAHAAVYADLLEALDTGRPPRCDGRSACDALELANAITLSSHTGRAVELPIDRAAYSALLRELRNG